MKGRTFFIDEEHKLTFNDLEELYMNNDIFIIEVEKSQSYGEINYQKTIEEVENELINLPSWFEYKMISHYIRFDFPEKLKIKYIFYVAENQQHMRVKNFKMPYKKIHKIDLAYGNSHDSWKKTKPEKNRVIPEFIKQNIYIPFGKLGINFY
jgi:hypothetical protein